MKKRRWRRSEYLIFEQRKICGCQIYQITQMCRRGRAGCDKMEQFWRRIIIIVKHISSWKLPRPLPLIKYTLSPPLGPFCKPLQTICKDALYEMGLSCRRNEAYWALGPVVGLVVGLCYDPGPAPLRLRRPSPSARPHPRVVGPHSRSSAR